jgi:hypothetical protein
MIISACTNRSVRSVAFAVLVLFSALSGYLLYSFSLDKGFILHVSIFPIVLFLKYRSIVKSMNLMAGLNGAVNRQEAIAKFDLEMSESGVNYRGTKLMFFIAGLIYLCLFSITYLYFYNTTQ